MVGTFHYGNMGGEYELDQPIYSPYAWICIINCWSGGVSGVVCS